MARSDAGARRLGTKSEWLARHFVYRIATGSLRPGDALPPLRDAAQRWAVNQATVRRAYERLIELRLVSSRAREGYFVQEGTEVDHVARFRGQFQELHDLLAERIMANTDLTVLGALRCLLALSEARADRDPECVLVECTAYQATNMAQQVRSMLRIPCTPVTLSQIGHRSSNVPASVRVAITTMFHLAELQDLLQHRPVKLVPVAVKYDYEAFGMGEPPREALVIARDQDQAVEIAADLAVNTPTIAWSGLGTAPELLESLLDDTIASRSVSVGVVLSPTLWECATTRHRESHMIRPLLTRISDLSWQNVAAAIGLPHAEVT